MLLEEDIFFELFESGDFVRIVPNKESFKDSENDWDNNWINTTITVKSGNFSGKFNADFMTFDFEKFKVELKALHTNLNGFANFNVLEGQLELKIKGDGIGHFIVNVLASEQPGLGASLSFKLSFDQTQIPELVSQLDKITMKFPIVDDFNKKNKIK